MAEVLRFGPVLARPVQFSTGSPFKNKCRAELPPAEFEQLINNGQVHHLFPNSRSLLFTLRGTENNHRAFGKMFSVSIDLFELEAPKRVGIFDQVVHLAENYSFVQHSLNKIPAFDGELAALLANGPNLKSGRSTAAFWLDKDYRAKAHTGFDNLSHLLANAGLKIALGLGALSMRILLPEIGGMHFNFNRGMSQLLAGKFGAEINDAEIGSLSLQL